MGVASRRRTTVPGIATVPGRDMWIRKRTQRYLTNVGKFSEGLLLKDEDIKLEECPAYIERKDDIKLEECPAYGQQYL